MKKNYTIALMSTLTFALLGSIFGLATSRGLITLSAEPNQNYSLTLNQSNNNMKDKNGKPLPEQGSQSSTAQEFVLPSPYKNTTIKTFYATKNDSMFIRLNNPTNSTEGISYFEKIEACNGMTSIYIDLNYGYVDILTGYEPGVFTNKYTIRQSGSGASGSLQKTVSVKGNYFRVQNSTKGENALIKSITINYGCEFDRREIEPLYTMQKGSTQDAVRAVPGHWFYHWNGNWRINESPKPEFINNSFESKITAVDTNNQGVWYRYQPETIDGLTNRYSIRLEVRLSVAGKVAGVDGDKADDVVANTWKTFTFSERTFSSDTQPFYLKVYEISDLPEIGYITVEVRNIVINRTLA